MTPVIALSYSFFFGLLHGILPDEHTWPITFSYAIGGSSGREGMKAGLYFSAAFTFQRMLVSELAYLALAPFLLNPAVNGIVSVVVGAAMAAAGAIVLRKNRYVHFHVLGHCHGDACQAEDSALDSGHHEKHGSVTSPPARWTIVHGFIAGFGFGGFSLFVNTVAAPAMKSPWTGFLPGLVFGLGTMIMLVLIGWLFGASLRWVRALTEDEVRRIGSQTGGRTLFFGGFLFIAAGAAALTGLNRYLPLASDYAFIALFMIVVAIPAFVYSLREILAARKLTAHKS
jgi:sulfite exporter TauE/SafE